MTEDEARGWIATRFDAEKTARIARFVAMVVVENDRQNLVAPSTVDRIWFRHVVDSAQLVDLADPEGLWLDVGTGGGFPGMVVAMLRPGRVVMVEPRRKRGDFLRRCVDALAIDNATVVVDRVEKLTISASAISARAVASSEKLLQATRHCATPHTRWVLPRGRSGGDESMPGMMFHVKQSLTDPDSRILIVERRR